MAPEQALRFAAQVDGLRWVKVGLELFVQAGPEVVAQLREMGLRVFLDLKFHDIPATMAGACRRAAALGGELITVHACAGSEALKAAQAAALRAQHPEPFALVTPGIRPKGAAVGDQARVMGPAEALAAGASQLVIGRPITKADDPSAAFAACCAELMC